MGKNNPEISICKHCKNEIQSIHIVSHENKCRKKQLKSNKNPVQNQNNNIIKSNWTGVPYKTNKKNAWLKDIPLSPNPETINGRNLKSHILSLYNHDFIKWEEVSFVKRALKAGDRLRYEIKIADPDWNSKISLIRKMAPKGLECYFTTVNGDKRIFAVYNLDIILGVCLGILDPIKNDYSRVTIDRISEPEIQKIIKSAPEYKSRIPFINHLIINQATGYDIYIVRESIDYYNVVPKKRVSFLFTIIKPNEITGLFILESLDENTATHLFKIDSFLGLDYEISKAKLRNYFQSNITNKRQKLYHDYFLQEYELDKISTLHHLDYESWRHNLKVKIKE